MVAFVKVMEQEKQNKQPENKQTYHVSRRPSEFFIFSKKKIDSCYNQIDTWTFHQALQP